MRYSSRVIMGMKCRKVKCIQNFSRQSGREKSIEGDLDIEARITLKLILKK